MPLPLPVPLPLSLLDIDSSTEKEKQKKRDPNQIGSKTSKNGTERTEKDETNAEKLTKKSMIFAFLHVSAFQRLKQIHILKNLRFFSLSFSSFLFNLSVNHLELFCNKKIFFFFFKKKRNIFQFIWETVHFNNSHLSLGIQSFNRFD